jgi:hypothetical protein
LVYITGIPLATVATVTDNDICIGTQVTLGSNTEGGTGTYTYTWTSVPAGFTSSLATPSVFPVGDITFNLSVWDGFVTATTSISVTVHPLPNTNFSSSLPQQCIDYLPYTLTQGQPGGGSYTGTGVSNPVFTPSVAGIGTFNITYTYTDPNGCTKAATTTIKVNPLPIVSITGTYPPQCYNTGSYTLTGGNPAGGTYSGTTVAGGIFYPQIPGIGTYPITYTYTDLNNCTNSAIKNIDVIFQPHITGFATYNNLASSPLDSVQLILQDFLGNPLATTTTDAAGEYYFRCLQNATYQLVPSTTSHPGGFNATDAMMAVQYASATITLTPLRKKASDVNNNGATNAVDALLIMRRFVGLNPTFPVGDWVFEIANPAVVTGDLTRNVLGLCVGDLNGSYTPFAKSTPVTPYALEGRKVYGMDEDIIIPLQANMDMNPAAISLVIDLPESSVEITGIKTQLTNYEYRIHNNQLRFAWYNTEGMRFSRGEEIISLILRTKQDITHSLNINLTIGSETDLGNMKAQRMEQAGFISPQVIVIPLNKEEAGREDIYLETYPNPFSDHTRISIVQKEDTHGRLFITDIYGRILSTIMDADIQAGQTQLDFDGSALPPGTYLIRYEADNPAGNSMLTRKLMIIR